MPLNDTAKDLLKDLALDENSQYSTLELLSDNDAKYIAEIRMNFKNTFQSETLSSKEASVISLAIAINEKNNKLIDSFTQIAVKHGVTNAEIAEIYSLVSLMSINNVFYKFRHFANKEIYNSTPARLRMNLILNPILGKEFFELLSTCISIVNGCEQCVTSHETSLVRLGVSEKKIFDAVRLTAVVRGLSQLIN